MQKSLTEIFKAQNVMSVPYKNGTNMPIKKYAEMTARSTTAETQNKAQTTQGKDWGYDLVKMTTHSPTCPICAMYQGRVYAITKEAANGKYKTKDGTVLKFPYLYETAFVKGYETIHPNCRHRISIFPPKAYTSKELLAYSQKSTAPFEDTRTDKERKAYAEDQAVKRRRNENYKQYERIKAMLPNDAPKSFAGFVRMKQANSEKYQELMSDYRYVTKVAKFQNDGIIDAGKHFGEKRGQIDIPYEGEIFEDQIDAFNKKALESIIKETGYDRNKAQKFQNALIEWFGDDYEEFTKGNRRNQEQIINEGLKRMGTYSGSISRGMNFKDETEYLKVSNLPIGSEFLGKTVYAWSSERDVAENYAAIQYSNCHSILIQCENNKSAVGMQHISKHGKVEAELLAPSTAQYKISSKQTINKYDYYRYQILTSDISSKEKSEKLQKLSEQKEKLIGLSITFIKVLEE